MRRVERLFLRKVSARGCEAGQVVTVDNVRRLCLSLPRTTEHLIRDRVKFRVKQLVYVSFSRDETLMGFGFPKELRT